MLVGPLPTPGIAFITWSMRADAGVVISASHNPYQDNGIKIFAADGFKLPDEVEADIERRMEAIGAGDDGARAAPDAIGKAVRIDDAVGRYVQFLKHDLPQGAHARRRSRWSSTARTARPTRSRRRCSRSWAPRSIELNVSPDGRNINDGCGALHPEKMAEEVRRAGAHLGVALDGDADRLILADEKGIIVDGDQVMAILGTRMLERRAAPGADGGGDGDVEPRPRAGAQRQGGQAAAHRGRRPLRRRGDARARAVSGRRAVGAHHLPRPCDDRRRHRGGAARAGGDGRRAAAAVGAGARR